MPKKSLTPLLLLILVLFSFTGCSYTAYKDYYSSVDDYENIWRLTGFNHSYENISPLFPESIDDLNVQDFLCRYDQQLPLGEGVQVFLKIQYANKDTFSAEIKRISSLSFNCDEHFESTKFSVYATRLGENFSSEYALIDEEQQNIYYIYLQNIPKEEVEFDNRFLPDAYEGYGEVTQVK